MSSYRKEMVNPKTGKTEHAFLIDDLFGPHRYGVVFPSDVGAYDWKSFDFKQAKSKAIPLEDLI